MHECLNIVEVVERIAQHIYMASDNLHMALACKAFYDPCMNVLWREKWHLTSLILLLPPHTRSKQEHHELAIVAPPSAAEWERFQHCARRVKEFTIFSQGEQLYHYACTKIDWDALTRYHPGPCLLPNLRSFSCQDSTVAEHYHLFIQPSLDELSLSYGDRDHIPVFLETAKSFPSSLKTLDLELCWKPHWNIPPSVEPSIRDAVSSMSSLTWFTTHRISPETLRVLSSLPQLKSLQFEVYPVDHDTAPRSTSRPYRFGSLKYLVICSQVFDTSPMVEFFDRLSAPTLKSLRFRVFDEDPDRRYGNWRRPTAAALGALFTSCEPLTTLRTFAIETYSADPVLPEHLADGDLLAPLLGMARLEKLRLGAVPLALKPRDVRRMAHAWPDIEDLELSSDVPDAPQTLRLEHLVPFAAHCAQLRRLCVPLSVPRKTRCLRHALPPGTSKSVLCDLYAGESKGIVISPQVEEFLKMVFPDARLSSRQSIREAMGLS